MKDVSHVRIERLAQFAQNRVKLSKTEAAHFDDCGFCHIVLVDILRHPARTWNEILNSVARYNSKEFAA
jgi:hypothetical protein